MVSLASELALAYVDMRVLEGRLRLLEQQIELLEKSMELNHFRLQAGSGTELAVVQIRQQLDQTMAKRPDLVRAKAVAVHRIAILIGIPPKTDLIRPGELPEPPQIVGIGLPAGLITRRADVHQAEMQYAAAVARIGAAQADRYPRLSLSGSLYFQADSTGGLFNADALIYSLGPGLRFPLFEGGRITQTVHVRKSQAEQARLNLQATLLKAVKEVEDAVVGVLQNQQRVTHTTEVLYDAQHQVELAKRLYDAGLGDQIQWIETRSDQVDAEEALMIACQYELEGIIHLYRSLGGGWEPTAIRRQTDHAIIQRGDVR
jgi:NodT family efflux transporter outer membrane factor (OMF) lipoprotein